MASLDTAISLTTLAEIKAFLGASPQKDGIWIYCSQSDATAATVEITDTTIILIITGGVAAGTNTLTFADADKDTITELITAINAVTGWKSGAIYNGSAPSTDLIVTGALSCLTSANEITLKIADDYLLTELINRASDLINRYCNRILKTTTYSREIYYGSGYDKLLLDQYPVTRVTRLSVERANSFSIKNTSTDANFCTVEVTATTIRLIVDGGVNAYDTNTAPLLLATYATIDLLIAAIHALGKGWVCTTLATDTGSRDASELLIRPSMAVTATAQAYCETVDDDITDYKLLKPTEARNEGIIEKDGAFTSGYEYFLDYTAGYITIPYSLEQACIYLVKYKYDQSKRDSGLKSEKFGEGADYSYTLQDLKNGLPSELLEELNMFKKRDF
ncbi:MAG: hypothetical protein ISS41_11995 [Candidatus Aminicenantes bacterium]|nr:hypothetical protein [Candidatus Aminicenantes bacterium]